MDRVLAAAEALRRGGIAVVLDDRDRENEADLFLAAGQATPEKVSFFLRHTSGILCVAMDPARVEQLALTPMVVHNTERHQTAFTVSVDLRAGTTTGVSATDRGATIRSLADPATRPEELARPGHIFPLRARPGGVLERAGHTEAAVDLAGIAGVAPVVLVAELTDPDGEMARGAQAVSFAEQHGMPVVSIAELAEYRRSEAVIEVARTASTTRHRRLSARLPRTEAGHDLHAMLEAR